MSNTNIVSQLASSEQSNFVSCCARRSFLCRICWKLLENWNGSFSFVLWFFLKNGPFFPESISRKIYWNWELIIANFLRKSIFVYILSSFLSKKKKRIICIRCGTWKKKGFYFIIQYNGNKDGEYVKEQ